MGISTMLREVIRLDILIKIPSIDFPLLFTGYEKGTNFIKTIERITA